MESLWRKTSQHTNRESLETDISADTLIIGGGLAGILTAFFLKERGIHAIVLEANEIGSGQTENTTAKITSQHNHIYEKLISSIGKEAAGKYAKANQEAIFEFSRIINERSIDCDFEMRPAFIYSTQKLEPLEREAEAAASLGLPATLIKQTALPFEVLGAVRFDEQAQFHPLKFLYALAQDLEIYEHTKVDKIDKESIYAGRFRINAKHVVFACHYPFLNAPGYYFLRMHQERSYLIALENAAKLDGMYISLDEEGYTMRNYNDLLIFGGGNHRTGENSAGGKYDELRLAAFSLFPGCREVARWSAQDCMPHDNVPYIGQFSTDTPGWYVATGFKKWGMSTSMVCARLISDAICGIENPYAEVFSPARYKPIASVPELLKDAAQAVKGLLRENLTLPSKTIEDLPRGHGGIVEVDGEKVGVYKDEDAKVYLVDTRCPHLGCQLSWNPDEKSWDCPCHGSRFDYTGKHIDNPAQSNIMLE